MKYKPYWAGLIFRNHNNKEMIKFSEIWFANICRYSKRDQLSLIHSADQANIKLRGFYLENDESKYHKWPVKKNKNRCKSQSQILLDYFPKKYIKNLSKKLKDKGELFIEFERKEFSLIKKFYRRLINKLKNVFKRY